MIPGFLLETDKRNKLPLIPVWTHTKGTLAHVYSLIRLDVGPCFALQTLSSIVQTLIYEVVSVAPILIVLQTWILL